jgi:murein DD-endopeptidase MepM/ murein hydrolase activator NlpD
VNERRAVVLLILLAGCDDPAPKAPPPIPVVEPDWAQPIGPEPAPIHEYHVGEIRRNDSFSTAALRMKTSALEVDEIVRALDGLFDFRKANPGQMFEIWRDAAGKIERFRYTVDRTKVLLAFRGSDGALRGSEELIPVRTTTVTVAGEVDYSLYLAMEAAGEGAWLTLTLVEQLFPWDVDFFTETQKGDRFRVVVEKRYAGDDFVGYGRVLGAEYAMVGGKTHRAFRYELAEGKVGYYDDEGKAVEKAFLKSPVRFASITSRYGMRRHPILKYVRAHRGVDYGAPMGTQIWSVGDGVVSFAGWSGGYGRVVMVKHANGLQTRYAHLRGFAKGIRAGVRVRQKQVIGYVGKSGLATGPHLHFEVMRNGRHMNPLVMAAPPAPPIPDALKESYLASIAPVREAIDRIPTFSEQVVSAGAN